MENEWEEQKRVNIEWMSCEYNGRTAVENAAELFRN